MARGTKCCINGCFLVRHVVGVDYYAREKVRALDGFLDAGGAALLLLDGCEPNDWNPNENVRLCHCSRRKGHGWEQFDLRRYVRKSGLLGVNLCNTAPLLNPGVVCNHDMTVRDDENNYSHGFVEWNSFPFSRLAQMDEGDLIRLGFYMSEIHTQTGGKITVLPNALRHMNVIEEEPNSARRVKLKHD